MNKTGLQGYRKNFIKILTVFMVAFPWITYLNLSEFTDAEKTLFSGYGGISIDFFIYHKEVAVILMAVLAVLWFMGEQFLPRKVDHNVPLIKGKNKCLFILSGVFAAGLLVSTIFSKYPKNAFWGSPTVGEGFWSLLGYIIILMAFYNTFANTYAFDKAKLALTALSGITVVLTMIEWFYKPLLEIGFVQALVAPSIYADVVANMEASVFDSAISLTFFNPGYFGGFVCLLLPFMLMYALQENKPAKKACYSVLVVGLLFAVISANTTTALYIAILEVVLVLAGYMVSSGVVGTEKKCSSWLQVVAMLAIVIVGLCLSGVISGNSIFNIFSNANSVTNQVVEERFEIEDIQLDGKDLILVGEDASLRLYYVKNNILFFDENDNQVPAIYNKNEITFREGPYENISMKLKTVGQKVEGVLFCVEVDAGYKATIDFFILEDGSFSGIGQNAAIITNIGDAGTSESLKGMYGLFTGRGYAWVNSLPVLKDTLLIGKGPGNFAYYFKQYDYVGLLSTHGTVKHIIDKPHNTYLQYATEVGLPAALAFFGVFVLALVKAVRVFWKNKKQITSNPLHVGAMVSITGFLIYSFINDSMMTVTPVACMIAGLLLASCYVEDSNI